MKVLYVLWNYPQLSETYIATEIAYAIRHGVHVEVWSRIVRSELAMPQVPVHRGTLAQAVDAVRPDLVHVHYLPVALQYVRELRVPPVVVRVHSFDWNRNAFNKVAALKNVKRIILFPRFAEGVRSAKAVPLPVAYDSMRFRRHDAKDRALVLRMAAGLPCKGLDDVFQAATLCPNHRFILGIARAGSAETFPETLRKTHAGSPVDLRVDVGAEEAESLTRSCGIYLYTADPAGHAFGLPVSIAEAMATGAVVLVKDVPGAKEYIGDGAILYKTPEEAADAIRGTAAWTDAQWTESADRATARAQAFSDETVLPALLETWREVATGA